MADPSTTHPPPPHVASDDDDPSLSTRAPESDATHPLPSPSTTTTTTAPDHTACTTDRPLPPSLPPPRGELTTLNSIPAYLARPPTYPSTPARLLLLLTNGTGIHSRANQLQADAFAARGFLVAMPDQFGGDPAPPPTRVVHDPGTDLLARVQAGLADVAKSFRIDMWLARHGEAPVCARVRQALAGAREQFADAVATGGGVYGAGYCFGAKYVLQLLGGKEPELKAGAIAHGTLVTAGDVEGVARPVAMACVEQDSLFPDEVREAGRAALARRGVEHEVRVFAGVPHGFAVLGDYEDEAIQAKQTEAFEMMCAWLDSH